MRFLPMHDKNPNARIVCCKCTTNSLVNDTFEDQEGAPFNRYYCFKCKVQAEVRAVGVAAHA